ncbi:HAD family hydrolase [Nocardia asteroides]|uniref:Hydrolase n=1 Tax=Nocardia asteroides NBRC 15531 TaxID=1110697 RepID=U5EEF5_NOCAS|nr:HAD family phosphatase [Nocardia asteroides]GAD85700.1 putative hydrolase [Nocardia asteroides NBRC 15531]SFN42153.1 haloacid dehalogenase superfamily, subfamily IA, variant 3 with third motif having DD or ED/haloacid dehalogenase superfamily, subfamily IA, variant 1 with third motif having Dx(3-4)D or Dx(3-4)E [Nocardia asteroides]VEG36138.1 Phosphorylated carbohydrates phosphatase TM_1254 [Nocardia asteroides]
MSARPAAVLWDMDGTLLDSEKLWDIAVRELAREHGRELTDEVRHALIGASGPNALRMLFDGIGVDATVPMLAEAGEFLERRVTELMLGPIPWRPGAKDALAMVRAAGMRCALVTNTKRSLTEYGLDTLGRDFFDTSVCGDEVAHGKPDPAIYRRAADLLGVDPLACVAIEDSPTGALAAQGAGCGLIVIPCEIAVPEAPGRVFRESLVGLSVADLTAALVARDEHFGSAAR